MTSSFSKSCILGCLHENTMVALQDFFFLTLEPVKNTVSGPIKHSFMYRHKSETKQHIHKNCTHVDSTAVSKNQISEV